MLSLDRPVDRIGWPTILSLGAVVVAFMALSLSVTATGTARFMVPMGYGPIVGYAVGATLELAKDVLLVAVLALWAQRSAGFAAVFGIIWIGLVTYSGLATHATVSTAIASSERAGSWKMEVRGNAKAELASVEQQLAVLSRPAPPRPARTVHEALAAERVPNSVWQDSQECGRIQDSAHFARACAQVVQLRRELAASQDYERLSTRTAELRKSLADSPIVATSDPLPAAFSATLGRVLPLGGTEGVALLLTLVVELLSCCGVAGLKALYDRDGQRRHSGTPAGGSLGGPEGQAVAAQQSLPRTRAPTLPTPSLRAAASRLPHPHDRRADEADDLPSNVLPMRPRPPQAVRPGNPGGGSAATAFASHVPAFVRERLRHADGESLQAKDLRAAYERWCTEQQQAPLSMPKLAAELKALGYDKRKSNGLMRYRDLQLAA